jgi:hypothetical protein
MIKKNGPHHTKGSRSYGTHTVSMMGFKDNYLGPRESDGTELWELDKSMELLGEFGLLKIQARILPEGTYTVKIGKFLLVEAELHEDYVMGTKEALMLYPTGLVEKSAGENPFIVCEIIEDEQYLTCTGFINKSGAKVPIQSLEFDISITR